MIDEEMNYWKTTALWMADILAATAHRQLKLKSVSRIDKMRHTKIAELAAGALQKRDLSELCDAYRVIDRLKRVAERAASVLNNEEIDELKRLS